MAEPHSSHPYQNLLATIRFCIRRNGVAELFLIPLRTWLSPVIIPCLKPGAFGFRGRELPLFYHRYNSTWSNERAVEVPIGQQILADAGGPDVLEVGNVLSHYQPVAHTILDKFERRAGVLNEDITVWRTERRFDLILSISTFEHIGCDDDPQDPTGQRILDAIANCRALLKPGGRLVITASPGYNPAFDALVRGNRFGARRCDFLIRRSRLGWDGCDEATCLAARYNRPYPFGNGVVVAEFGATG